jgi:outer membrane protein TolC
MRERKRRSGSAALAVAAFVFSLLPAAVCPAQETIHSLEQCIDIAQKNNPEIGVAGENYRKAEGNLLLNYGNLLPNFNLAFSTGHRYYGPSSVQIDESGRPVQSDGFDYEDYGFRLASDITLFNGGGNISRIRSAMYNRDAAREGLRYRRDFIAASVIRAYYDLVRARMLLRVEEESVEAARKNLERTEALLQVGSATRADVLKAKVRHSNTRLSLIQVKNGVEFAKQDLLAFLKMDGSQAFEVDTTMTIEFKDIDAEAEIRYAMTARSDLRSLEHSIKSAKSDVSAARSGWMPTLGASFNYYWNDRSMAEDLNFFQNEYSWAVTGYLSFDIFDRFQTASSYRIAKADARIAEYNLDKAKLDAANQIRKLILTITQARERITVASETVEQANEDLRLAEERYRVGAGTMLETIDALVAVTQAKAAVIEAKRDFLIATADLAVATGKQVYR